MKRILVLALCLASVLAVGAGAASVSSAVVRLYTSAGNLPKGAPLKEFSSSLRFQFSTGYVECTNSELTGKLVTNEREADSAVIEHVASSGCRGGYGYEEGFVWGYYLPWKETFKKTGQVVLKATGGTKRMLISVVEPVGGANPCNFEAMKVLGGYNLDGAPIVVSASQLFPVVGSQGCVASGKGQLRASFEVSSSLEPVMGELK
jgi:hypothetical protein